MFVLNFQIGGQDACAADWQEFFDTIGKLTELRSLSVRISPNSVDIPYHQQISAGCPFLRSLRVRGQETIAADLVRDLGRKITSLVISCSFTEHSVALIQALTSCGTVEEVTLPCSMVGAIGHLHSLKSLKLIADHGPGFVEEAVISAGSVLWQVERLEVCSSRNQVTPDPGMNRCMAMIATQLKNCKYVDLRGLHIIDEFLSEFINEAKKVQYYELCCRIYHLLELEKIESVATVRAVLDSSYMSVPYVINTVNRLRAHPKKKFYIFNFHFKLTKMP